MGPITNGAKADAPKGSVPKVNFLAFGFITARMLVWCDFAMMNSNMRRKAGDKL